MTSQQFYPPDLFTDGIRRLFTLSIVEINAGEPTPIITTKSWYNTSQFHTFCRVLQVMLEKTSTRPDDIFEPFDIDDPVQEDLATLTASQIQISPAKNRNNKLIEASNELPLVEDAASTLSQIKTPNTVPTHEQEISQPAVEKQVESLSNDFNDDDDDLLAFASLFLKKKETNQHNANDSDLLIPSQTQITDNLPQEVIQKKQLDNLLHLHSRIAKYYVLNNNIHSGTHHTFVLTRFIIDENTKKTYSKEITMHTASSDDVRAWFGYN